MNDGLGEGDTLRAKVLVAASLALLCGLASFVPLGNLGIFSDDWNTVTALLWRPSTDPLTYSAWLAWHGARPALAAPLALQGLALRTLGLPGAFCLTWLLLSATAYVLYCLTRRQMSRPVAWLTAAVFLLHGADTTHLWLISTNLRFAMLLALLAVASLCHGRPWWAAALALVAFETYEISPFLLLLAPWFSSGGSRADIRRAARILIIVVAAGAVIRLPWLLWWTDVRAVSAGREFAGKASLETYLLSFPGTLLLAIAKWPARALLRCLEPQWRGHFAVALAAAAIGLWRLGLPLAWRGTAQLGWRFRARRTGPAFILVCDPTTWHIAKAAAWGAIGAMAAAAFSFAAAPNFQWTHATRANYFVTPGASILAVALLALLTRFGKVSRGLGLALTAALLAAFFTFRFSVGRDYREAAREQRRALRQMRQVLPSVPRSAMVVLVQRGEPAQRRAATAFTPNADWEVRGVVRALYGDGPTAIGAWSTAELAAVRVRLATSGESRPVIVYDLESGEIEGLTEPGDPAGGRGSTAPGVLEYLRTAH